MDEQPRWGTVLRALREARGVTQDGWAARLGVSRATVQRWESGGRAPDPSAEDALITACRETGLLRSFDRGPLAGLVLTADSLRDLLAEARLGGGSRSGSARTGSLQSAGAIPKTEAGTVVRGKPEAQRAVTAARHSNLPAPLTSFVGRQEEIAALRRRLGGTRLLTLTGVGGCGKTRLALELAGELLWAYPNGIWLVELAALADPALLPQTVAAALSIRATGEAPVQGVLVDQLAVRHLLLILDNCEHLLSACAELVETLLRACPHLEVLSTSREPLGINGETIWRVPPLSLPTIGDKEQAAGNRNVPSTPQGGTVGHDVDAREGSEVEPDAVLRFDAVRLFVERARQYQPDFALVTSNEAAIVQICRWLDGIPLAIELAAARVTALSAEQIAERISDRFRLLTGGSRTALPRHQTLRTSLDWSYELLSEPERAALRRLSVFVGGFTLEAAAEVAGESSVLDLVASLVRKSLVQAEEQRGVVRYRLLETVAQYADEKLDEVGELAAARGRHFDWCLTVACAEELEVRGPRESEWLARLEQEHDNLRAALRWSLAQAEGRAGEALRLAASLTRFWEMRGHLQEGRQALTEALSASDAAAPEPRAKALQGAGVLAYAQGDYAAAHALFEQSLALERELGNRFGIADALGNLGRTALRQGDYTAAREQLETSLTLHTELGHKPGVANVQFTLGVVSLRRGDYDAARARFEVSLALNRERGNTEGVANALEELAAVIGEQGDDGRQAALLQESLALYRELGDRSGVASVLGHLGTAAWARGAHERALALLEESLVLYREVGERRGVARLLGNQSLVALYQGDPARAATLCRQSLTLCREAGDTWAFTRYLPVLAAPLFGLGQTARAACLFGAAAGLRERHGTTLPPVVRLGHEHTVAAARAALGEAAFASAWAGGHAMPSEAAIDCALSAAETT